jgi:hypothetical protein
MKTTAVFLLAASLLTPPLPAQAQKAQAMGCFTKPEETAEQIVRFGLYLREGAHLCSDKPLRLTELAMLWEDIDQRLGSQFARQSALRKKAFEREFAGDSDNRLTIANGRLVNAYRSLSPTALFCDDLKTVLQDVQKHGWSAVTKRAAKGRAEVELDYDPC